MKNWKHYLLDQRNNFIIVLFFLLLSIFLVLGNFYEFIVIYGILFLIYSFIDTFFIRTNSYFIIIRTRKHNYISAIILCLYGLFVLFWNSWHNPLAFNFIPVKTFMGVLLIAISILILPKNIIINKYGIYVNEMLTRKIDYCELDGFVLSENTLTVSNKDFSYHFKIYPLTSDEIDLINNRINEYKNIQS